MAATRLYLRFFFFRFLRRVCLAIFLCAFRLASSLLPDVEGAGFASGGVAFGAKKNSESKRRRGVLRLSNF
jgi:hypothetical protein